MEICASPRAWSVKRCDRVNYGLGFLHRRRQLHVNEIERSGLNPIRPARSSPDDVRTAAYYQPGPTLCLTLITWTVITEERRGAHWTTLSQGCHHGVKWGWTCLPYRFAKGVWGINGSRSCEFALKERVDSSMKLAAFRHWFRNGCLLIPGIVYSFSHPHSPTQPPVGREHPPSLIRPLDSVRCLRQSHFIRSGDAPANRM